MSIRRIFAEVTVSISELRNKPKLYFTDQPIAVISHNRPVGYVIGARAYEDLVSILCQSQQDDTFEGRFQPTAARLREIVESEKKGGSGVS